jgi:hypothetical protein
MSEERILLEQMVLIDEQGCMKRILFVDIGVDTRLETDQQVGNLSSEVAVKLVRWRAF